MKVSRSAKDSVSLFASACDSLMTFNSQPVNSARQPDVLSASADGLRELLLRNGDVHGMRILIDDDRGHLGRRHGIDDELGVVVVERNDIDAFAGVSLIRAARAKPRMPTQAPTGSTRGSLLRTAIFARTPASRAAARMLMRPWPTSGTSSLKQFDQELGRRARQEQLRSARLRTHLFNKPLMRSWERTGSRGIISSGR